MKKPLILWICAALLMCGQPAWAQQEPAKAAAEAVADTAETAGDTLTADSAMALVDAELGADDDDYAEGGGLHKELKRKFVEGSTGFMSLVALALVLGLAFCIERIIYLSLAEVNTKRLMQDIDARLEQGDVEGV